jgi:hypothetical protein
MIKALARGFRWRRLLEDGSYRTMEELAAAEGINASYVSRLLRLTILAPDVVTSIMDGTQSAAVTLGVLMQPFEVSWKRQASLRSEPWVARPATWSNFAPERAGSRYRLAA